ncbi:DNA-processing protein DprA [Krasilnikovia sp. MM14-A1259]|uniref:DNA-processing protein DprA n=1 Tax=Krasilnikovia sp. MM14-A1259 TaxID=3373539 RepID=UPI0038144109
MSHPDSGVDAVVTGDEITVFQAKSWHPTADDPGPSGWKPGMSFVVLYTEGQSETTWLSQLADVPTPPQVASVDRERLLVLCAVHHGEYGRIDGNLLARTAQTPDALDRWYAGEVPEQSPKATKARRVLEWALNDPAACQRAQDFVGEQLDAAAAVDAELTTVLDDDYPANLRMVPDAPPFLFHRGALQPADARSIAVVGTRRATQDGLARAKRMARGLSDDGVVVVSGLARGIDTAAHTATIERGHRTVAVIGTGIAARIYPPENAALAERIVSGGGAVISQFWPTDPPDRWRFPARNITMSGFTQGTVVVEASETSGAKMQAQAARRHAKTVFLLRSLAAAQPWARAMVDEARAQMQQPEQLELGTEPVDERRLPLAVVEVSDVDDVLDRVAAADAVRAAAGLRHELAHAWPALR